MEPIIANPDTFNRADMFQRGSSYVTEWCQWNNLPPVLIVNDPRLSGYGRYDHGSPGTIRVNVGSTRLPARIPGYAWSFTGYKADLTVPGVIAHEAGHHAHLTLGWSRLKGLLNVSSEPAVSAYEPNLGEVIAEALKVFILNPELLRAGRPLRWHFITEVMGLKPLHATPWLEVLRYAHSKHHAAARKWIADGHHEDLVTRPLRVYRATQRVGSLSRSTG
jgi:hypothetical protein